MGKTNTKISTERYVKEAVAREKAIVYAEIKTKQPVVETVRYTDYQLAVCMLKRLCGQKPSYIFTLDEVIDAKNSSIDVAIDSTDRTFTLSLAAKVPSIPLIKLLLSNDRPYPDNKLLKEDVIKCGTTINIFDYSIESQPAGTEKFDYTDIIDDSIKVVDLFVEISDGTNTEQVRLSVDDCVNNIMINPKGKSAHPDNGDRMGMFQMNSIIDTASMMLGHDFKIEILCLVSGLANLKSGNLFVDGIVTARPFTLKGRKTARPNTNLVDSLKLKLIGYSIEARFSEYNS